MTSATLSVLDGRPYVGYAYAYPHKTAYRPLSPPIRLEQAWQAEDRSSLFCYLHIPFCEMRCGFCNLFTTALPPAAKIDDYLAALRRQAQTVQSCVPDARYARFAIGGGTPTYLTLRQLGLLFDVLRELDIDPRRIPGSVETSPATATPDRVMFLREAGVCRVSIGVQTFFDDESKRLGRTQPQHVLERALRTLSDAQFPCLNLDLIYGGEGQSVDSFVQTVVRALAYQPQELYLYPLYVRPLTGLARLDHEWDDFRLEAYRAGRAVLLDNGYRQVSMRMFRAAHASAGQGPDYCCQRDGMIGLGCGARSYTRALHYSNEYAVGRSTVRSIINTYVASNGEFAEAGHGFHLDRGDQVRRFVIKSLLQVEGLSIAKYKATFGTPPTDDLPELARLIDMGLAELQADRLILTEAGLERSDAIGSFLYSAKVQRLSEEYQWA